MQTTMRVIALATSLFALITPAYGKEPKLLPNEREAPKESTTQVVTWKGVVTDLPSSHNSNHEHRLKFKNNADGKEYSIVDSPDLAAVHHERDKSLLVEIEGEITPRFLFWGNNLLVHKFTLIKEIGPKLTHTSAPLPTPQKRLERPQLFER